MDASPTALFDSYEADFKQIIHSIRDKLEGDTKDVQGEQRKAALRRVEMELDEADEMVRVPLPVFLLPGVEGTTIRGDSVGKVPRYLVRGFSKGVVAPRQHFCPCLRHMVRFGGRK